MRMDRLNSVCAEVNVNIFSPTSPAAGRLERLLAPHFRRMYPGQSLQYGRIGITRFPLPFRAIQQDNALDRTVIKVHAHLTAQRPVEFSAWRIGLTIEINALRIAIDPNGLQGVRNEATCNFPTGDLLITRPAVNQHHQTRMASRTERFGPVFHHRPFQRIGLEQPAFHPHFRAAQELNAVCIGVPDERITDC